MAKVEIFDPLLCSSDCVCGPNVESKLKDLHQDIAWLIWKGVEVHRYKPSQDSLAFERDSDAKAALRGLEGKLLPLVKVDGELRCMGRYLSRTELASWLGIEIKSSVYSEEVSFLVAISAAVAADCKYCLVLHQEAARKLGVSDEDIFKAIDTGRRVRDCVYPDDNNVSSRSYVENPPPHSCEHEKTKRQDDSTNYLI